MKESKFLEIAETLKSILPSNWEKVVLFGQIEESSYELFFYVKIENKYVQCFELEKTHEITRKDLRSIFKKLFNIFKPYQAQDKWTVCTFILSSRGKFSIKYDYEDLSDNLLKYKEDWKKKYLV